MFVLILFSFASDPFSLYLIDVLKVIFLNEKLSSPENRKQADFPISLIHLVGINDCFFIYLITYGWQMKVKKTLN